MRDHPATRPECRRPAAWPGEGGGSRHFRSPPRSEMSAAVLTPCVPPRTDSAWLAGLPHRENDLRSPIRLEQTGNVPTDRAAERMLGLRAIGSARVLP